jgi:tetratricopeptide (TPR) repeat protein
LTRFAAFLYAGLCWYARAQAPDGASIQPLLKLGDSAFAQGDYESARQSFEKAWQFAQKTPADSQFRYDVLRGLTSTAAASGEFAAAERYMQQAVEWRESLLGRNDSKIADDLLILINLCLRAQDLDRALAAAQRLQAIHVAAYTAESVPVADDLLRIAQIYQVEKKPRDALHLLMTADQIRTQLVGPLDPGRLPILDRMNEAFVAIDGGGGNEAIYRQALVIRETLYGKDSPELISTLEGLAQTCVEVAAEPLYQRLLLPWWQ